METKDKIRNVIKEALGVPDNLYETSQKLFDKIIPKFKGFDESLLDNENSLTIGFQDKFRIADFEFSKVFITFYFEKVKKIKKPEIIAMSSESESEKTKDFRLRMIRKKTLKLNVKVILPENFDFKDFDNFLKTEKKEIIESLNHELKHSYDAFKKIYDNPYERALYNAMSTKRFGIWTIDRFFHDLYYTTVNESLVRPSEVAAAIRNNEISQKEFLNFLYDNDTYKNLRRISEFNYETFRLELVQEIKKIDKLLKKLGYDVETMSIDEKIDEVLRLMMVNISNWTISEFQGILTSQFMEQLLGFTGEKERIFQKFKNRYHRFNTPEEFFRYYEKLFKYVGDKMIRKIAKLYAITKR